MNSLPSPPATVVAADELAGGLGPAQRGSLRANPKHAHRYQYSPLAPVYNVAHEVPAIQRLPGDLSS
jgi:hypothetical protein